MLGKALTAGHPVACTGAERGNTAVEPVADIALAGHRELLMRDPRLRGMLPEQMRQTTIDDIYTVPGIRR